MVFRRQYLGTKCTHCYWGVFTKLSVDRPTATNIYNSMYFHINVYMLKTRCSHWYLQFSSNTTEFIQLYPFPDLYSLYLGSIIFIYLLVLINPIYVIYLPWLLPPLPHMDALITQLVFLLSAQHPRQGCLSTWAPSSACSDSDSLFQDSPHHGDTFQLFQVLIQHASHPSCRYPHCPNSAFTPQKESLLTQLRCQHFGPGHLPENSLPSLNSNILARLPLPQTSYSPRSPSTAWYPPWDWHHPWTALQQNISLHIF